MGTGCAVESSVECIIKWGKCHCTENSRALCSRRGGHRSHFLNYTLQFTPHSPLHRTLWRATAAQRGAIE